MTYQERRMSRIRIVRLYCGMLEDTTVRAVCYLLSRGAPERDICRQLEMGRKRLELVKLEVAVGLRRAGLRLRGEEGQCRN